MDENEDREQLAHDRRMADQRDARRWRALMACGRVRVLGWAGLADPESPYAHIGFELWTVHDFKDHNAEGCKKLAEFADKAARVMTESAQLDVKPVARADADGHCTICGCLIEDPRETEEPHECPPGFRA